MTMSARNAKTILVSLLTVIMLFSLMTPFAFAAGSASVADTSTTTSYSNAFGDSGSTRYTGRIWTDKTVSTSSMVFTGSNSHTIDIGNSDFLVAYSALATSSTVTTETPVDVSFFAGFFCQYELGGCGRRGGAGDR